MSDNEWSCPICGRDDEHDHKAPELKEILDEIWAAREKPLREEIERLTAALRDRDELWCRALTVLDPEHIGAVTKAFNKSRALEEGK